LNLREARVTTIVPTFRRPQLLKRAVYSILNQTYGDLEVRILDNASGDETEQVARELVRLDGRVHYHRHPANIGSLQNMIFGMQRVATPYFNILCDDDLLMPRFLETGIGIHDAADTPAALLSARVVIVDQAGRMEEPYPHPARRLTLPAPEGVSHCLRSGMSMPGVIYRTKAMEAIGPPRTAWWNWTESGWNALAAMKYPIEFTPEVGAIVLVHAGSASKQMEGAEFRASWFHMLAELRAAASSAGITRAWWNGRIQPLAYLRFFGTVTRLCHRDGAKEYARLEKLAIASGLNGLAVRGAVTVARTARLLGIGALVNRAFDRLRDTARPSADSPPAGAPHDEDLRTASKVWMELNRQAGLG
jgi:hypothetical protein